MVRTNGTASLGARVKALREAGRMSLRDAAARTGVSKSMLAKIEYGATSPTATVLGKIAEGFGVSISHLVGEPAKPDNVIVMRTSEQPVFAVPTTGFRRRSLSPSFEGGSGVDFVANSLPPGQSSGRFPPHRPGVDETLVVATGRLTLQLDDQSYDLEAGDSVFYRAHVSHRFDNPSVDQEVVFYIVINNTGVR
ncbi:MAG: helix-turn-helix domain-containing protein [Janthinobacterium lividum]